jgi:predicted ATPase/DNA-binding CsgD family transcriptional regulator
LQIGGIYAILALMQLARIGISQVDLQFEADVTPLSTPFFGRDRELEQIAGLLTRPSCRLLTLVGAGGIGKTRLALQVATCQQTHFGDGVVLVALASIDSPEFLAASIGAALEIPFFGPEAPLLHIMRYVRDKRLLLIMDNFEHLLEAAGCLTELLQAAPHLKILVTSRERLNLREEWVFPLNGLSYPAAPAADSIEHYSAVQLFVQRARQIQPLFVLSDHIPSVLSICRQVEGMPLGLELAASWLHVLSCEQIATRMQQNLDLLTTPLRNIPERHRSMRAVFAQSWSLLSADEQAVLRRLSLFHGGFDEAAATEVGGATLPVLGGLADKSLLRLNASGRYDVHELLRQFAGEKVTEAGEISITTQRYLAYFLKIAEAGEAHAYGHEQVIWYDRLEVEMDNLRAALAWSLSTNDVEKGLRIAAALRWVWETRGYLEEGVGWFKKLFPQSCDVSPEVKAKALHRASELAGQLAAEPQATLWVQEALHLAQSTQDRWNLAWSLSSSAYFTKHDPTHAMAMLEESLALFREVQDALGLSHALRRLAGCAIDHQQYTYALSLLEQALATDRQAGDKHAVAWDLCYMGVARWIHQHQPKRVIPLYQESIALFEELGDVRGRAHPLLMLAEVEQTQGNFKQSLALFQEALLLERTLGIRAHIALFALAGISNLAARGGAPDRAASWVGTVQAVLASGAHNTRLSPLLDMLAATVATVRAHLNEEDFQFAWDAGKTTLSLEQAVTDALQAALLFPERQETSRLLLEPLSPREYEVLGLLGAGCSNADIAQKLVISVATVKVHTRSIYGKLNVSTRTQAILQAQKLQLL